MSTHNICFSGKKYYVNNSSYLELSIFFFFVCLFVLGFNDTSTLVGYFVLSPREREKR